MSDHDYKLLRSKCSLHYAGTCTSKMPRNSCRAELTSRREAFHGGDPLSACSLLVMVAEGACTP